MIEEPTTKQLLQDLSAGDEATRRYAAEDLGDAGEASAVPALVAALRDPAVAVREAAADALLSIGGEGVCREIVALLDDDDSAVRNLALEIFEQLDELAVAACIRLYQSPSHDLRKISVDTLGKILTSPEGEGFDILVRALEDPHINVASAACEALGQVGGEKAAAALQESIGRHPWMDATIFVSIVKTAAPSARDVLDSVQEQGLQPEAVFALRAAKGMLEK